MARKPIKKRVQQSVLEAANIDTAGLDPEMRETLGQEAARRVGAAGVGVRTENPIHNWLRKVTSRPKPKLKK
jgi:hypothetical protein